MMLSFRRQRRKAFTISTTLIVVVLLSLALIPSITWALFSVRNLETPPLHLPTQASSSLVLLSSARATTQATTTTTSTPQATLSSTSIITDPEIKERIKFALQVVQDVQDEHAWFADFDFSTGFAKACGVQKCFYQSIHNETAGYLVANASQLKQMKKAHALEQQLAKEFGTAVLSHSVEIVAGITQDMAWVLKHYTRQWGYEKQVQIFSASRTNRIVLQRVTKAPQLSLTCAFTPRKGGSMLKRIPQFVQQIKDPKAFRKQFEIEHERMLKVTAKHSRLLSDFQFIVDDTGRMYQIDLDRNGADEGITDKEELKEELEWLDADLTWLLQQLTPSLLESQTELQRCRHSFCKKRKTKAKAAVLQQPN